jgi:hypothetical protein
MGNRSGATPLWLWLKLMALFCALLQHHYRYAQQSIFVWLLLCSMISSVTVICARGWSSMLTRFATGECAAEHCVGDELFKPCALTIGHWLFWILIALVVVTAIWSATYLNKAMMIYGNTEVVPVYYCTFTLISIIGGAVVYREFANITVMGGIMFGLGCVGAFAGVYLITTGRKVVTRKGSEVTEEEAPRFCRLSALDRAAELQRQRRRISIQPVGAPLLDILSFRRDDEILTGVDSIAEQVASEMFAGEHLQAAYRVRDSMGPQAAVVAGAQTTQHLSLSISHHPLLALEIHMLLVLAVNPNLTTALCMQLCCCRSASPIAARLARYTNWTAQVIDGCSL